MRIDVQCHIFPKIIQEYMLDNPYPKCIRTNDALICDFGSQILALADDKYDPASVLKSMDEGQVDIARTFRIPGSFRRKKQLSFV